MCRVMLCVCIVDTECTDAGSCCLQTDLKIEIQRILSVEEGKKRLLLRNYRKSAQSRKTNPPSF